MKHITYVIAVLILFLWNSELFGQHKTIHSPDDNLKVTVNISDQITWSATYDDNPVIEDSPLSLHLEREKLGTDPELQGFDVKQVNGTIEPVVSSKNAQIIYRNLSGLQDQAKIPG